MRTLLTTLLGALCGGLMLGPVAALAELEVSTSVRITAAADFHAPLSAHGTWIQVGSYGHCWRPAGVVAGWRPYCHGHWLWTDCGWYWASDEPWAWACYHYGWWVHDSHHGWVWVPGLEWAPAWVSWRVGGGYCGWAPLAPRHTAVSLHSFVFVEARRFHEPVRPSTLIVNQTAILKNSSPVPGPTRESRNFNGTRAQTVVVNNGPSRDLIETATRKPLNAIPIRDAARQTPLPSGLVRSDQERVGQEKPLVAPAPGKSTVDRERTPKPPNQPPEPPGKPAKPPLPDKDVKPPKPNVPPSRPQPSPPPPAKPRPQPKSKGDEPEAAKGKGDPSPAASVRSFVPLSHFNC